MDISLRHIEVFRAIMQAGSVTGAARLLFTSQPTVSRELARLETLSGLRLFDREGGRLLPTAQALLLLEEVERAYVGLERINSVAQSIRRFEHGQLSLSCLPLFSQTLLPPVCKQFQAQHPGIGLSITAQESPLLEEALSAQRHDLGLTESEHLPRGTQGELLFCADMVCILADDHPLLARPRLALADFRGQDFINLSGLDIYRQTLDEHFRQAGVDRRIVVETTNAASVCAMVRQRLGVAIINPLSAMEEAGRGLAIRPLQLSVPYRVMLIRPDYRPSSSFVEGFSEALRTQAKALQEQVGRIVQGGQGVNRSG
ncbi:DNA-binding transcriptional LysR family regulator [Pseudomonas protegens]|jgi:DNA-binding transcriptional LysR family regulator|uniref:Transcriptional activator protein LysR n=3 Tax=Pseudomonas TaxID=286 RepID=A0A2C9EKK1_PSEPH|nr:MULTISPECIES: LysR family transcriptional regulator [Pseudomonas]GED78082.1 LysR family transcriptional regulator [Pseudomonas fluorescens]AGL84155.1 transcriptional activator protein LysR [Pseudomonas protegens CHA0]APC22348.1 LysR family transcriptional regulator [Pseudomonas protegens]AQT09180.1 LysR family transcriptional regulator [Pseudomonas protegens]MBB1612815.1 LysR family transcriptional regulator [Pseudomonas sp. UMC65]